MIIKGLHSLVKKKKEKKNSLVFAAMAELPLVTGWLYIVDEGLIGRSVIPSS